MPGNGYVVACSERLRDGIEEWAKCFDELDWAVVYVNEVKSGFGGGNKTATIYEIGKRVDLATTTATVHPDPVTTTVYTVPKTEV